MTYSNTGSTSHSRTRPRIDRPLPQCQNHPCHRESQITSHHCSSHRRHCPCLAAHCHQLEESDSDCRRPHRRPTHRLRRKRPGKNNRATQLHTKKEKTAHRAVLTTASTASGTTKHIRANNDSDSISPRRACTHESERTKRQGKRTTNLS